jgi:hypothetical protein
MVSNRLLQMPAVITPHQDEIVLRGMKDLFDGRIGDNVAQPAQIQVGEPDR